MCELRDEPLIPQQAGMDSIELKVLGIGGEARLEECRPDELLRQQSVHAHRHLVCLTHPGL